MATDSEVSLTSDQHAERSSIAQSRSLPAGLWAAKTLSRHIDG